MFFWPINDATRKSFVNDTFPFLYINFTIYFDFCQPFFYFFAMEYIIAANAAAKADQNPTLYQNSSLPIFVASLVAWST